MVANFDVFAFCEDRLDSAEVDVGSREIVDALMIANVAIVLDEGVDLSFEIAGQILVFEQDAVFQGLMPALDLPFGLTMMRSPTHMCMSLPLSHLARSSAT